MALRIKSDAKREDALRKAKSLIESEAWGKGDQSHVAEVEGISEAVEGYDRAKAGSALLSRLGEKAPDADSDRDGRFYLGFAATSFGDEITKGVRLDGQKSLIAGGSQVVETPLVATDPYTIGNPLQSFLNAIPAVKRPRAYSYLRQTVRTLNAAVVAPAQRSRSRCSPWPRSRSGSRSSPRCPNRSTARTSTTTATCGCSCRPSCSTRSGSRWRTRS